MELHILEHRLKVASIEKEGVQVCTHGLVKLAFLASRTRAAAVGAHQRRRRHVVGPQRGVGGRQRLQLAAHRRHQNRQVGHCAAGRPQHLRVHAVNVSDGLHSGSRARPADGHAHAVFRIHSAAGRQRGDGCCAQSGSHQWICKAKTCAPSHHSPSIQSQQHVLCDQPGPRHSALRSHSAHGRHVLLRRDERDRSLRRRLHHIRFFSFSLIEGYISLVMDEQTTQRFPNNVLFTSASGELWKMVRIGGQPLGFDECGIVAQISEPLATADIPAYYISTFKFDHALVPEENIQSVIGALRTESAAQ
uniref:Cytosolic arginine sensor for mTORC1 subunit 2 n=1 Tax=Scophthalmus maximus TaxID=52904 RepID=A0A8D3E8X6_SCOMX